MRHFDFEIARLISKRSTTGTAMMIMDKPSFGAMAAAAMKIANQITFLALASHSGETSPKEVMARTTIGNKKIKPMPKIRNKEKLIKDDKVIIGVIPWPNSIKNCLAKGTRGHVANPEPVRKRMIANGRYE